jgi:hypothetical protein
VHDTLEQFTYDVQRALYLEQAGVRHQIHLRPEQVSKQQLRAVLAALLPLSR